MSIEVDLKVGEVKFDRKYGREFHRSKMDGKEKAIHQASLEFLMLEQTQFVFRSRHKGRGVRVISFLEHLPLLYL